MKEFILGIGRFLINLVSFIMLLFILIVPWYVCIVVEKAFAYQTFNGIGLAIGFLTFIILLIIFVASCFVMYILLDMCDNFSSIAKSLKTIETITIRQQQVIEFASEDVLRCSKCGTCYNAGDKFCEECGTELNQG